MNKESIKSATLTVLVIISLFFTWNMWNLQPSYEEFQNNSFFESVPIGSERRTPFQVIRPKQLYIHTPEAHFSTLDNLYLEGLWTEMQEWNYSLSNNKNITQTYTEENFNNWIHSKAEAKIEIRFLDGIPLETFKSMFEWDTDTNESINFDRIYLNVPNEKEAQKVYFVSTENLKIVETSVNLPDANRFVSNIYNKKSEFTPYFAFGTDVGNEIMLPEDKIELDSYQYLTDEIDDERFKDALFSNPRLVKQDVNFSSNRYTDSKRELNIFPNEHLVRFVNPTLTESSVLEESLLLDQSIKYLNDHGGWTDDYLLFNIDKSNQQIRYVMSIGSIPVLTSTEEYFGPTMISQRWGQNEIAIYERPSYQLMTQISSSNPISLISGREIAEILKADQSIDSSKIENIYIAYELGGSTDQKYVKLTPSWCIAMEDGTLMKLNANQGRGKGGLE
jgi:regulatory protein YycH of two-component signal transduction system YycFG